jgi:hypothetical protein
MAGPVRVEALEVTREEDGFIVHDRDRDRVHYLNHTGVLVLELCDGTRSAAAIARLIQRAYGLDEPPQREVDEVLGRMKDEGLVR